MNPHIAYYIALTRIENIGHVHRRILLEHFGEAEKIFKAKESTLKNIDGIGEVRARSIKLYDDFSSIEQELHFIEKNKITIYILGQPGYPLRLANCYDPPVILYGKGDVDYNAHRVVSIIGTRKQSDYGKQVTELIVQQLKELNVLIVSGLAYGIDAIAHKAAVQNGLPTVGVLAHGLDQIYPAQHTGLAREMVKNGGGLLTEFRTKSKPDRHNFPIRNRIVAGLADATIVVETAVKGGSMITAELANGYNRDVFALPGKITDERSSGCHYLIHSNKAQIFSGTQQFIEAMGWSQEKVQRKVVQKELFISLGGDEKVIADLLLDNEGLHIDEISLQCGLSSSSIAAAILQLELKGVIICKPGKMYCLV